MKDGDSIHSLILKKPILHLMTHFSRPVIDLYFDVKIN